jgi:hypothetical protein
MFYSANTAATSKTKPFSEDYMTINCPNCKAELSDTFIVDAFMEIPIEEEYGPVRGPAISKALWDHVLGSGISIHEPQGETINAASMAKEYEATVIPGLISDVLNYGTGYVEIDMGKATHIPFTATRDIPCNLDAFEWSPEAMAYVEKVQK